MQTVRASTMTKQTFFPKNVGDANTAAISKMGLDDPLGTFYRCGREWRKHHASRHETFSLVAFESFCPSVDQVGYTKQEEYIKINFWLSGKHTTVLDKFGQFEHARPEVFITSGPVDMTKVDVLSQDAHCVSLGLCVLRDFFRVNMEMAAEELPEPLRSIVTPQELPFTFHRMDLTSDLVAAARGLLLAPPAVRREPMYAQAKAIELMCLLLNLMRERVGSQRVRARTRTRDESRLYGVRELLSQRYSESVTLAQIAREVGLNRMALTTGFKELFGMSVYEYLRKERMERAYDLLQDEANSITQVAQAVGYEYSCNFSTTFRAYFGCTPQNARDVGQKKLTIPNESLPLPKTVLSTLE
jgi:AraC-like DNA-binding protein